MHPIASYKYSSQRPPLHFQTPFYEFQEEDPHFNNNNSSNSKVIVNSLSLTVQSNGTVPQRSQSRLWNVTVNVLLAVILLGVGWIGGFLVRWGVHKYYIDPQGHCMTPTPYK